MKTRKLANVAPGDVVFDTDGDPWKRTKCGAAVRHLSGDGELTHWRADDFGEAEEQFGPFRLPEHTRAFSRAAQREFVEPTQEGDK